MATALQILKNTFGVKAITPTDPGIGKLAALRTGNYAGLGNVNITPSSEAAQLLGLAPDPLATYNPMSAFDKFITKVAPPVFGAIATGLGVGTLVDPLNKALTEAPVVVARVMPLAWRNYFISLFKNLKQRGDYGTIRSLVTKLRAAGYGHI